MKQTFELKYIKRYLIMYGAVVAVMVLFYVINSRHNPTEIMNQKIFSTQKIEPVSNNETEEEHPATSPFRLLEHAY